MMRIVKLLIIALLTVVSGGCGGATASPMPTGPPPAEVSTETLATYEVVGANGTPLGPVHGLVVDTVDGLVVDTQSGETLYVVVLLKDIYNFGKGSWRGPQNRYLLIPWSHLHIQADQQLTVDVDMDVLAAAPTFRQPPDTAAPAWDETIRQFWAEQ